MPHDLIYLPPLLYAGAAASVLLLSRIAGPAGRSLIALLGSIVGFIGALLLVHHAGELAEIWTISSWSELAGATGGVWLGVDPLGAAFLLLVGLVGVCVFAASLNACESAAARGGHQAALLILLAGLAATALAGNLLTLLISLLLLDAALLLALSPLGRPRWLLVLAIQSLIGLGLLLAATLLLWRDTGDMLLAGAGESVFLLVVGAAAIRMAPLPISLFPVAFESLPRRLLALLPLVTLGTGALLLGRLAQGMAATARAELDWLASLAAIGVGLAGWVAWRREETSVRLLMLSAAQAAWVLWAFAWGLPVAAVATAWSAALALAALALWRGVPDLRRWQTLPGVLAALVLSGAPGSALWATATSVGGEAWQRGDHWLMAVAAIGLMASVTAIICWLVDGTEEGWQRPGWTAALVLAGVSIPIVGSLWGLRPPPLPGVEVAAPLPAQLAIPILGWSGGLWLWQAREMLQPMRSFLYTTGNLFSFVWLWRFVGRTGWLTLRGLRGMVLVLEGENYGWLLLFLFITMIFLLQG